MKKRFEMKVLLSLLVFSLVSISPLFAKTGTFTDDGVLYTYEYTEDEEGDIKSVSSFTAQGTSAVNGHVTLRASYRGCAISSWTFSDCTGLTSVTLPSSITRIPNGAFRGCIGLEDFTVPKQITGISYNSFEGCINLRTITFDCDVISVPECAFESFTKLERVQFTSSSVEIGGRAFKGCTALKVVTFPNSMEKLVLQDYYDYYNHHGVFENCTALEVCVLPSSVDVFVLEEDVFAGCRSLTSITLASTLNEISPGLFYNCSSLNEIDIPKNVQSIGGSAFSGCSSLTEITVPENVTSIGSSAFLGCIGLININLPENLIMIGSSAFEGCTGLKDVTVPKGVTSIGWWAFQDCSNLKKITFHCDSIFLSDNLFDGAYQLEEVVFTGQSVEIEGRTFKGRTALKRVIFPNSMEKLVLQDYYDYYNHHGVFENCTALEVCTLPSSVDLVVLENNTFSGCRSLTSITLASTLNEISPGLFYNCSSLTEIIVPENVTSIGSSAFKGCTNIREMIFHCKTISLSNTFFGGVDALEKLVFTGESVTLACGTSQGSGTFEGVKSLKTVVFPSSMKKLVLEGRYGAGTFRYCSALEECVLPNEVDEIVIGEYCFDCCSVLKSIALPSSVTELPRVSFAWCMSLTELKLPKALTVIGDRAIEGCRGLTNLTIPASVTSVGARAFEECSGLTEIVIPASVTSLGADAFKNCTALEYVKFLGAPPAGSGNVVSTLTIGYYLKKHEAAWAMAWDSRKRWRNLQMMLKPQPVIEIVDMDWTTGMATLSWGADTAGDPVSGMFDLYCSDSTNSAGAEVVAQDVTVAGASVSCFTSQSSSSSGASLYSGSTRSNKGLRPRKYWVKPKGESQAQYESSEPQEVGRCHALLVGMTSLGNAQTEILAWESLLTTIYDVEIIKAIGDIDKKTLIGHLDALAGKAKAGDLVFYIHSGHGTLVNGDPTKVALAVGANEECFTAAELREALNAFNSGVGRVLMINSCYSGGMLCGGKNIAGMAACSANQLMKDSTFLSDCLLTAGIVNGGAIDSFEDGWVSGDELFTFSKKWFENSPYGMTPRCLNNGMLANIVFAKEVKSDEDIGKLKKMATLGDLKVLDTGTVTDQLLNVEFKWKDPKNANEIAKEIPTQNFVAQFTAGNQLETIPCSGVSNSVYKYGEVLDEKRTTNGIEEEIFKDNVTYSLCVYPKFKTGWGTPTNKVKFVKSVPTRFKDLTHALMARPFSVPTVKFSWSLDWAEEKEGVAVIKYIPETLKEFKISFQEGENLFSSSSYELTEVIKDLQKGLFALSFEVANFKTGIEYKAKVISKSNNADIVNGSASDIVTFKIDLPQTFTMTVAQVQEKNPNIALIASNGAINLPIMIYDHDGDGKTTYEECYAGTDPFNSSSHCNPMIVPGRKSTVILASVDRATSFAQSNETITLHWAGADARVYRVYGAESLDGEWTLLDTLEGVEGTMSLDVSQSSAHFFKMVITLAEEELTL